MSVWSCVVLLTCSSFCWQAAPTQITCFLFCPGFTSSARDMHWRSVASRSPCLRVWEPSWRLRDFYWRRNWSIWASESLRLPWHSTQTQFQFHQSQAMYVSLLWAPHQISPVTHPDTNSLGVAFNLTNKKNKKTMAWGRKMLDDGHRNRNYCWYEVQRCDIRSKNKT